ncbi:MAG: hypothetical protein GX971_15390 [Firmicutes bacterium]|nr:hypothetical protein [Bacillota bacterium]
MEPLGTQLYAFGIILLAGVNLGLFFDLFRVIRGLLRPGLISTPILDLLFWALITPVLVLYLILANWGELRGYVVIGLLLGLFFYRLLLSGMVIALLLWLVDLIRSLLNMLISLVLWIGSFPVLLIQEARFHFSHRAKNIARPRRLWRWSPRLRWKK